MECTDLIVPSQNLTYGLSGRNEMKTGRLTFVMVDTILEMLLFVEIGIVIYLITANYVIHAGGLLRLITA